MDAIELFNQISDSAASELCKQKIITDNLSEIIELIKQEFHRKLDSREDEMFNIMIDICVLYGVAFTLNQLPSQLDCIDNNSDLIEIIKEKSEIALYNCNRISNRPNFEEVYNTIQELRTKRGHVHISPITEEDIKDILNS